MQHRNPLIYTAGLFALACLLSLTMGTGDDSAFTPKVATAANPLVLPQIVGTWTGTWTDTLYAVSGAVDLVIWSEGADYVATGSIDVSQISGALGVLTGGAIGLDNGTGLDISFDCASLGNGTVVLTPNKLGGAVVAAASGSGNVTAPLDFGPFTLTGTMSDTEINGSFDFTSPTGGKGIAQLTRSSVDAEPVSWGEAKAAYRR